MSLERIAGRAALLAGLAAVAGCSVGPRQPWPEAQYVPPPGSVREAPPGTVYNGAFELFGDLRARNVGDILTIRLIERTNAAKESSASSSKGTDVDTGMPIFAGRPVTSQGTPILNNELQSDMSFTGQAGSSQSNRLDGTITVTVVERLSNGNLLVSGEKWIGINQGEEYIRLSGVVRAVDIEPDNSVPSTKVAGARIDYRALGALADSNRPGWLARFFNSPWFPF